MTGSNMFLIFKHGVRLLGGEFLRSKGNAAEKQAINWRSQQNRVNFLGEDATWLAQWNWSNPPCSVVPRAIFFTLTKALGRRLRWMVVIAVGKNIILPFPCHTLEGTEEAFSQLRVGWIHLQTRKSAPPILWVSVWILDSLAERKLTAWSQIFFIFFL